MKSITQILGGCQMVFGISYDIQEIFEGYVTGEHRTFIQILQVIEEVLPACDRPGSLLGRKSYDETAVFRQEFLYIIIVTFPHFYRALEKEHKASPLTVQAGRPA